MKASELKLSMTQPGKALVASLSARRFIPSSLRMRLLMATGGMKMKRFAQLALVLAIMLLTASVCWGQFTSLQSGFTQSTFGTSTSFLGGEAFAPNGDVLADDCSFHGGTIFRFPLAGAHPVAENSGTSGLTGCGLTNHPNGNLYSNTDLGVVELSNPMTSATAPTLLRTIGSAGNALGITVDPQSKHLVYVGLDCSFTATCTIYDLDPSLSEPASTILAQLDRSVAAFVDGIAFDPSGNFLFLSTRDRWNGTAYVNFFALTILRRNGTLVQQILNDTCNDGCLAEPDGIAFHAGSPQFVVIDSNNGTMTRFDFPSNDFTQVPIRSEFASGGLRGDLSQVGPDGCLYISQGTGPADIAQICGGFAPPTGSSQSVTLTFTPSATPETQIATVGNASDPSAQSLALTLASVTNAINVTVTFFYETTDISSGTHGIGIADGDCEMGATEATDFDCRSAANFTYQTLTNGDRIVPHIIPSHNNLGVWVRVTATVVSTGLPAVEGVDYKGPVQWYYAWNTNPPLVGPPANPAYLPGWNNLNPQMYDRPGENVDIAFIKNITTYSKFVCNPTCVGTADPGTGGKTGKLNDIVVAAPPNPPTGTPVDTIEPLVPAPSISPFIYVSGLPMLVAFKLEHESTETSDPTALTAPHSVNVGTLDHNGNPIPVQFPTGAATTFTYSSFFRAYFILLSPAPYKLSDGTSNTVYTLQINSDLFPQPVNATFKVCTLAQVQGHTCP
jgi:hypothetical protein